MDGIQVSSRPELWGGIECTRCRVKNQYWDQLEWGGHWRREDDVDAVSALGIETLRYPALWETVSPQAPDRFDWTRLDRRLNRLRDLRMRPIAGFVHHGSGPAYTGLLDDNFATGLAKFAGQLARRHPWIDAYTPVNEPLTTARFSALYGHWYPHRRDGLSFATAMLNECRAVVLAMRAIREVRPDAELVQTEDIGKTHSTPRLEYQAEFENERRWLTYDLLLGRVDNHYPLGSFFLWLGVPKSELAWFRDNPCPPDIFGINYYVTSERFLDHRRHLHPSRCWGGNDRHKYADTEAVRARPEGNAGLRSILNETWQRYRRPMAVTEAHLGCTREEQLRWLWESWQAASAAREAGQDVRAVTVWSILGSFNWNNLMTGDQGTYESGAFDLRDGVRRPTALAGLARELCEKGTSDHPLLAQPGWWRRVHRFGDHCSQASDLQGRPVLVTGGSGTLGSAFVRICGQRAIPCQAMRRPEMDIADRRSVEAVLKLVEPWAVINAAGYVQVDAAEQETRACLRGNLRGATVLAAACARLGIPLLTFSSDLVFDGQKQSPYCESDEVSPLNMYGRSKARAERRILQVHPAALVVRTSAFFGPWDEANFVAVSLRHLADGNRVSAIEDAVVSPTYVPDLVHSALDLLIDGEKGLWHLANRGAVSWSALARMAASAAGYDPERVVAWPLDYFRMPAQRPMYSVLGTERSALLPALEDAMVRYTCDRASHLRQMTCSPQQEMAACVDTQGISPTADGVSI